MFSARNKNDLIIEVWEKLDCESVGADEIRAIEAAVIGRFGEQAVDSPMFIARLLADEGAVLRHSEIMELFIERVTGDPYEAAFRNIVDITDLGRAASSLKRLENLRKKLARDGDKIGLRRVREHGIAARTEALERSKDAKAHTGDQEMFVEITEWFTLWLQSPEMFEAWVELRTSSPDFLMKFGQWKGSRPS